MKTRMTAAEYRQAMGLEAPAASARAKPQIRLPKIRQPNKTEAEYGRILAIEFPGHKIIYEGLTFKLPSGTRYTPDYTVWLGYDLRLIVETKGAHIHSAASLRAFKEARAAWPAIQFRFAQKRAGGWAVA